MICSVPAGTGKTFISLGLALGLLRAENNNFTKIYLVKSVTTLKGEEIGYLKGDLKNKDDSSLNKLINMFKDVEMSSKEENVRNSIINIIEEKFEELESIKPKRGRPKKL